SAGCSSPSPNRRLAISSSRSGSARRAAWAASAWSTASRYRPCAPATRDNRSRASGARTGSPTSARYPARAPSKSRCARHRSACCHACSFAPDGMGPVISIPERAERLAQRAQVGLVAPPLVEETCVDRLAHLRRARGGHHAAALLDVAHAIYPGQAAEFHHLPRNALGIAHQFVVTHVEDPIRVLHLPARHQRAVVAEVRRHLFLVVGVRIRAGEQFLEV